MFPHARLVAAACGCDLRLWFAVIINPRSSSFIWSVSSNAAAACCVRLAF